jgi:hypothetical protein
VAAILELTPLDLARRHRQSRRDALEGLDAGHLVDRDGAMGIIGGGRGFVDRALLLPRSLRCVVLVGEAAPGARGHQK